jgi:hypothetical protein
MNCREWDERIALYAGSDLSAAEAAAVERQVGECAGCQVFVSGMRESLRVMREAHAEEVSGAAFAAVRARVMSELMPRAWWRWGWVWGLAGAALLAVVVFWPVRHEQVLLRPATVAVQRQLESPAPGPVLRDVGIPRGRRRPPHLVPVKRRRAVDAKVAGPPIVVKIMTDDPDVVIYWITDKRGE